MYGKLSVPTEVYPGLWLAGSRWPFPPYRHFDLLVTVCEPHEELYSPPCNEEIRLPMVDRSTTGATREGIVELAFLVAQRVTAGDSVIIRCHWGVERSAMVAALSMRMLTAATFAEVLTSMRQARSRQVLFNPKSSAWAIASGDLRSDDQLHTSSRGI